MARNARKVQTPEPCEAEGEMHCVWTAGPVQAGQRTGALDKLLQAASHPGEHALGGVECSHAANTLWSVFAGHGGGANSQQRGTMCSTLKCGQFSAGFGSLHDCCSGKHHETRLLIEQEPVWAYCWQW